MKKILIASLVVFQFGCAKHSAPVSLPIVQSLKSELVSAGRASVAPDQSTSNEVRITLSVSKSAIFDREFLYGADLQYSSFYDAGMDLYNQSLALGHIPVRFRISGDELQLVADNKRLYLSEVNHPEQLLSRFKIESQTSETLVISGANSGGFLAQVFEGTHSDTHGGLFNLAGPPPRDQWIRSFEFSAQDNLMLQQTSVVLADGSIAEFLEAIFPRENLAPGKEFAKFELDPENPAGGDGGLFDRFRFLNSEKIFAGEKALAYAQHYDISGSSTIDWYVTRNIPDEDLAPVSEAVEGWNRYFEKFSGIERKVLRFKGRLPEGIRLGDPRYNIINWDNRLIAGAAYESQASDPQTGKQSHSLIYMPAAWLRIGFDYWKNGQSSEHSESVGQRGRHSCLRDLREGASLLASGRLPADEIKLFGIQLLKQTLFHEVGHALGLAHNFKGSLSFDRSKPGSIFSTSIMDYNDFEEERTAFSAVDSADGPQLEYDRQILSALYNQSRDYKSDDPVVPMCNDAEADNEEDAVDPLCVRYDVEHDPSLSITTALNRITEEKIDRDVTLAQALLRVPALALDADFVASIKTESALKEAAKKFAQALKGSLSFYIVSGKESLNRVVRTNLKTLLAFEEDILPTGYDAQLMRERVFIGVQKATSLTALPDRVLTALFEAQEAGLSTLAQSPYLKGLTRDESEKSLASIQKTIASSVAQFTDDSSAGLLKMRTQVLGALVRHKKVPFYFGLVDYEAALIRILVDAVISNHDREERVAAATSLMTFSGRYIGDQAIQSAVAKVSLERVVAANHTTRENAEAVLHVLTLPPAH